MTQFSRGAKFFSEAGDRDEALGGRATKRPRHRPKTIAKAIRDVSVAHYIMWTLILEEEEAKAKQNRQPSLEKIMAAAAKRFCLSDRTVWSIWADDKNLPNNWIELNPNYAKLLQLSRKTIAT